MPTVRPTTPKVAPKRPTTPTRKPVAPVKPPVKKPATGKDSLQVTKKPAPVTPPQKPVAPPPPPLPPVAASIEEAVARALREEPVRMPIAKGEPRDFAIRPTGVDTGVQRFEIKLGNRAFQIALPEGQEPAPILARTTKLYSEVEEGLQAVVLAVNVHDVGPENTHMTIALTALGGVPETVHLKRTGLEDGKATYTIRIGENTLLFKTPAENDLPWEVARAASLYAEIPAPLRPVLKQVVIDNGPNPLDAYWEKTYNMPGFSSAASASNGVAYFWNGHRNLGDGIFHHEVGHLMGQRMSSENNYVPADWKDAVAADGAAVSKYAGASLDEDFAETWCLFLMLKSGKIPSAAYAAGTPSQEAFKAKFAHRVQILEAIYAGERKLEPLPKKAPGAAAIAEVPEVPEIVEAKGAAPIATARHDHDGHDH